MLVNTEILQDNVSSCEGTGCNLGAQKERRCNDGLGRCNEQCDEDCCVKNCLGYHALMGLDIVTRALAAQMHCKRKKKQSIQAKAKDSTTVINVHSTSSSIEKPNPPKLCKFKLHPEVKYDRLNISVHDRRNIPTDGIENSKSRQLKAAEYHLAAHMMD
ncbi:hypothetical protein FF1_021768 [Malus domestica]